MKFRYNLPGLIWTILILAACGFPGEQLPEFSFLMEGIDKVAHFVLFFIHTILLSFGIHDFHEKKDQKIRFVIIALVSCIYGIIMEILQATTFKNRTFEYGDVIANSAGCLTGFLFYSKYLFKIIPGIILRRR